MTSASHLIFSLHDSLYAVAALSVCEIIWLPELTPLPEVPSYIAGVVNLRGKVVPVMDLSLRLGYGGQPHRLTDSVIVLEEEGSLVGVIVNEVRRVQSIADEEMETAPSSLAPGRSVEPSGRFVAGVAKVEDDLIMVLHLQNLLRLPGDLAITEGNGGLEGVGSGQPSSFSGATSVAPSFCPEATPEERAVFRARARSLRQPLANPEVAGLTPLAVVGLNGEYFGIDLDIVREFSALRTVTPVPCCPEYVVGQMNLRGDILTLVDIRTALQMPLGSVRNGASGGATGGGSASGSATTGSEETGKVVVIQTDALQAGVLVDEVFDVLYLQPAEIRTVPAAVQALSEEYLKGTAPYAERMLSILDLPKILTNGQLIVNEEV